MKGAEQRVQARLPRPLRPGIGPYAHLHAATRPASRGQVVMIVARRL